MSQGSDPSTPPSAGPREPVVRALPASGRGPGVAVLASGAGESPALEAWLQDACRRLAHHGFVALAPPLPAAEGPPSDAERRGVGDAIDALFSEAATDGARLGLVGLGRGGLLALDAAARGARVALVAGFDAVPGPELTGDLPLATLEARVLWSCGEKDPGVEQGHAAELIRRLRAEGVSCELRVQPGARPGFADPGLADRFDAVAARAAWDAVLARLRAEL